MRHTAIIITLMAILAGCAGTSDTGREALRISMRVATVSLIDRSSQIDAQRVLDTIAQVRSVVDLDGQVTAEEIMSAADAAIDLSGVSPAERVLIVDIMTLAGRALERRDVVDVSVRARQVMDWIESAALIAR